MNVNHIRNLLYTMKKDYGQKIVIAFLTADNTDTKTGTRYVNRDLLQITKAPVLPLEVARQVFYDLGFLKANNNFTYGAEIDIGTVFVLIDGKDLKQQELKLKDSIFYGNKRYMIHRLVDLQHKLGYAVVLKAVDTELPFAPIFLNVSSTLKLEGRARHD